MSLIRKIATVFAICVCALVAAVLQAWKETTISLAIVLYILLVAILMVLSAAWMLRHSAILMFVSLLVVGLLGFVLFPRSLTTQQRRRQ